MTLLPINPPQLAASPVFSQGMQDPATRALHVGGQNGIDAHGRLLDGFAAQTAQAYRNLLAVLDAAGCGPEHVAKLSIYIVGDQDPREGLGAAQEVWGDHRTAVTVLRVHGLARPDALVEIDAIAYAPVPSD